MAPVTRLVTFVDVDDAASDARRMSVSARHEAVLADGRRALLLDDRGWSSSGPPDVWASTSVEEIMETARTVVGPDEPFEGCTQADMEADHWGRIQGILGGHGVVASARELQRLPHDVELSERLLERLGHGPGESL